MDPITMGIIAGAGMSAFGADQEDKARDSQRRMNRAFTNTLRGAYQNDPLLNQILGSMGSNLGQPFDQNAALARGYEQIGGVQQRRTFDAMRRLARQGFDAGGAQMQQFQQQNQQAASADIGALRDMVAMQYEMQKPQVMMQQLGQFLQGTAGTLGTGAQFGVLGNAAPKRRPQPLRNPGYANGSMSGQNFAAAGGYV